MKLKKISLKFFSVIVLFCNIYSGSIYAQNKHATGLLFDSISYNKIETVSRALKFNEPNQSSYSLKQFCPIPGDQGSIGTCSSWATGYAAMTIAYAIQNDITDKGIITKNAKSAMYLYNQIGNTQTCSGSFIEKNLAICKSKGDCDFLDFHPTECQINPNYNHHNKANQCKIQEYFTLFQFPSFKNANQKLSAVINCINSKKPIVVSLNLYESFHGLKIDGIYAPKTSEKKDDPHAVCMIGYDNISRQFEFINSWGTEWGNKGFFKMSYDDFIRDCNEAYQFSLAKNINSENVLKGSFQLLNFTKIDNNTGWPEFSIAPTTSIKKGMYTLIRNVKKDEFFRLKAKNLTADSYVYVLTLKPNLKAEILFPLNYGQNNTNEPVDIPLITSSLTTIELPYDLNNGYTTDQKGEDYLCILFSKNRILNLETLIKKLENTIDIGTWLNHSFGSDLISAEYIDYDNGEMSFSTKPYSKGNIVPIILKVNVN